MTNFVIAFAGHIDHGKTALIKAITGIDADTSPEERRRKITIDVGFVNYCVNDAFICFVDMPGHEKFIKNMVVSVSAINGAVLCVDANEGVKAQTTEHLQILNLLCDCTLTVALTKCDKANASQIQAATQGVISLLQGTRFKSAKIIKTSSQSENGVKELKAHILSMAINAEIKPKNGAFFMPIDRAFVKKGAGTVVAGQILQGEIKVNDKIYLYPSGSEGAVREINCCGQKLQSAADTRSALNVPTLKGVKKGEVLCTAKGLQFKKAIGARLINAPQNLKSGDAIMLFIGAKTQLVRISIFGEFCFLKAKDEIVACYKEKFLLRTPTGITLCAGEVLCVMPQSDERLDKREKERLLSYAQGIESAFLYEAKTRNMPMQELSNLFFFLPKKQIDAIIFKYQAQFAAANGEKQAELTQKVLHEYEKANTTPPSSAEVAKALALPETLILGALNSLCKAEKLLCLHEGAYIAQAGFNEYKKTADAIIVANGSVNVGALRDALCLSRKYVKAFLEYCDAAKIYKNTNNERTF